MTVGQIIELLSEFDKDTEVYIKDNCVNNYIAAIEEVRYNAGMVQIVGDESKYD